MAEFLFDTDVLIDHLSGGRPLSIPPERSAYSTLTRAELYAGRHVDESVVDDLLSILAEIPVERAIAEEGGRIRRTQGIGLADAIIAATALTTGRTLVTRNERHYRAVAGLKLRAPS